MDVKTLRKASKAVYIELDVTVADSLSMILTWAADRIEELEGVLMAEKQRHE